MDLKQNKSPENEDRLTPLNEPLAPGSARLPVPVAGRAPRRVRVGLIVASLAAVLLLAGGGAYWWKQLHPPLPGGIGYGNGRIEADEVDIATKYAGRIAELFVDIGDLVTPGQVVARMDTRDIEQSLSKSEAQGREAQHAIEQAEAVLTQQKAQQTLAAQEIERTRELVKNGWATRELLDQRQQQLDAANAGITVAQAQVSRSQRALDAAQHDTGFYKVQIADNTLIAPKRGRIQYRLANIGEVLPAGGKVFTLLDFSYVYMDVYLPTETAGKIKVGNEARIVLDAYPGHPIPANVSFVASKSQFTPKTVETKSERDKLMFRVRVRIDQQRLLTHTDSIRSGLPGVTFIRWDPSIAWPKNLEAAP